MKHLLERSGDRVPPSHKTAQQWADEWGLSRRTAHEIICKLMSKGLACSVKYRVLNGGCIRPVTHYYENDTPAAPEIGRESIQTHRQGHSTGGQAGRKRVRNT